MDFSLITDGGDSQRMFRGNDRYDFTETGLLRITSDGVQCIYSPNAWDRIEEKVDPPLVFGM